MSSETITEPGTDVADDHHDHPSDRDYVKVFVWLFILTAIEVAVLKMGIPTAGLLISLYAIMAVKFYLICGVFMHLKVDIKLFTQLFVTGLVLASAVYVVMLSGIEFWQSF